MSNNDYWAYLHDTNELKHGRKKLSEGGAPNGETTDPNYIPVGQKAKGVLDAAGHYIYDKAKQAGDAVSSTVQNIRSKVGSAAQQVDESLKRQYAVAREKAIGAYNNASGIMKRQYDAAREKALGVYNGAKSKVLGAYNSASDKVNTAVGNIKRRIHNKQVAKRNAEAEAARTSYGDMKSKRELIRKGALERIKEHERAVARRASFRNLKK